MRFNHGQTDTYDFQRYRHYYRASMLRYAKLPTRFQIITAGDDKPGIDERVDPEVWPRPDRPQTVEDLLREGYLNPPPGDPELAMIADRKLGAAMAIDDLVHQARDRRAIYEQNLYDLTRAECDAFNELARESWPARPEQYALYERRMQDLAAERRMERTHLWRDLSRLRLQIPEAVRDYLSAYRSDQLLGDLGSGSPETTAGDYY